MRKASILFFLFAIFSGYAQRYEILEGNLKNLQGITEYNILFDYSDMKVHGYETEEDFLQHKMRLREKEEGRAEQFRKEWFEDRQNKYEPRFIAYFNKRFPKGELKVLKNEALPYTMKIHTEWVYPGYVVEPTKITAVATVFETANPSKILVALRFDKSIGLEENQYNGNRGDRMAGAYEKLAKNLVIQLKRFL